MSHTVPVAVLVRLQPNLSDKNVFQLLGWIRIEETENGSGSTVYLGIRILYIILWGGTGTYVRYRMYGRYRTSYLTFPFLLALRKTCLLYKFRKSEGGAALNFADFKNLHLCRYFSLLRNPCAYGTVGTGTYLGTSKSVRYGAGTSVHRYRTLPYRT